MDNISADQHLSYWKHAKHTDYHARQFTQTYRSTAHMAKFMQSILGADQGQRDALDVCCGMGANTFFLSQTFPGWNWTGVDIVEEVLERGRTIMAGLAHAGSAPTLLQGDALDLPSQFGKDSFQIVTSFQTLLCMPDHLEAIDNLMAVCSPGGWVFISSLFTDSHVDAQIQMTEYHAADFASPIGPFLYNIFSLDKFRFDCAARGAARVESVDFVIDVDLPAPDHKVMGTYTVRLADDQSRKQISGPLMMPWKFIAIQKKS